MCRDSYVYTNRSKRKRTPVQTKGMFTFQGNTKMVFCEANLIHTACETHRAPVETLFSHT